MSVTRKYTTVFRANAFLKISGIVMLLTIIPSNAISLGAEEQKKTDLRAKKTTFGHPNMYQDINYLSCQGVHNGSFKIVNYTSVSMPTENTVLLVISHPNETIFMEFTVLEKINSFVYCAGLGQYNKSLTSYYPFQITEYGFHSSIRNAAIYTAEDCWNTERLAKCVLRVAILQEVLELPMIDYSPDNYRFWNFSYKLFHISHGWLKYLRFDSFDIEWDNLVNLTFTSIKELKITNNSITYMPSKVPYFSLLRILDFSGSTFHDLPVAQLQRSPKLEKLVLAESYFVTDVHLILLIELPLLKVFDFSRLRYPGFTIPRYAFLGMQSLEELDLSHNTLDAELPPFTRLPKLKKLRIGYLNVVNLHGNVDLFKNLPALKILDLSGNGIFYLPTKLFDYLNLTELYLSFNNFYKSDSLLLLNKILKVLDVSHNSLTNWPTFKSCSIEYLNMSYNSLQHIPDLSLNDTKIKYIDISRNNVSIWSDVDVFVNKQLSKHIHTSECVSYWVEVLDVSYNSIQAISDSMISSLEGLQSVNLLGNDFDCSDCTLPNAQAWLNESSCPVLHPERLQCSSPLSKIGCKVVDLQFYEEKCLLKSNRLFLQIGIPLMVFTVLFTCIGAATYWYRYELSYILHLIRLRGRKLEDQSHTSRYDAFICYSGNDRAWVMSYLAPALENAPNRYKLCLHDRDFPLGSAIVHNIVHSIEESRRTIVIVTEEFINSKWCQWELDMANHRMFESAKNFLILLELERVSRMNLPLHLKLLMDTRTYLEWPVDRTDKAAQEAAMKRLKNALGCSISNRTSERAPLLGNCIYYDG